MHLANNVTTHECSSSVSSQSANGADSTQQLAVAESMGGPGREKTYQLSAASLSEALGDSAQGVPNKEHKAPVGSESHAMGQCKPCLYLNSKAGCFNGWDCRFCHQPHKKVNRLRPCKATRVQCKQIASMLESFSPDSAQMLEVTERLGASSSYMRSILRGKQRELEDEVAQSSLHQDSRQNYGQGSLLKDAVQSKPKMCSL